MIELVDELMKKYHINIRYIMNNSDNDMEDIKVESYIIVQENFDKLKECDKCFIPLLKKSCLKNNKYGKRIESKDRWEKFNELERDIPNRVETYSEIDEDKFCCLEAIKSLLTEEQYYFLLYFYAYGCASTAKKYKKSEDTIYNKVHKLVKKIQKGGITQ